MSKKVDWKKVTMLALKTVPFVGVSFIGTSTTAFFEIAKELKKSSGELADKVERTTTSLHEASQLVSELESELTLKLEQVRTLKLEYEKYEQLASTEEKKAEAFLQALRDTTSATAGRERWIALAINLIAGLIIFALGLVLSHPLAKFLHLAS